MPDSRHSRCGINITPNRPRTKNIMFFLLGLFCFFCLFFELMKEPKKIIMQFVFLFCWPVPFNQFIFCFVRTPKCQEAMNTNVHQKSDRLSPVGAPPQLRQTNDNKLNNFIFVEKTTNMLYITYIYDTG